MRLVWLVVVVTACADTNTVTCADGRVCPAALACDDVHRTCVLEAQLGRCAALGDGEACEVDGVDGVCDQSVCMLPVCGDRFQQAPELCDETSLGEAPEGMTRCEALGFYMPGEPTCNSTCGYDTSSCRGYCGDGQFSPGFEICEMDRPPTESCVDYGYGAGVLECLSCGPGFGDCKSFEWDSVSFDAPPLDLHGIADNDVYAVLGAWGIAHFDGVSWTNVIADCLSANDYLQAVWQTAPGVVFAGGYGFVVRLDNGVCTRWMTAEGNSIVELWASGPSDIYALAYFGTGLWHFDGTNWTQVVSDPGTAVWGSGPTDVYASNNSGEYRHFNGTSWSAPQSILGIDQINAIWGTSATDVYIGGSTSDGNAIVKHSTNGTDWTSVLEDEPVLSFSLGSNVVKGYTVAGTTYLSAYIVTGSGTQPVLLASDGQQWVNLDAPIFGVGFVWASEAGRVFATSGFAKAVMLAGNVRVDFEQLIPGSNQRLAATSSSDVYLTSGGHLYYWSGATWGIVVSGPVDVTTDPAGNVYAIAQPGFFPSTNAWTVDFAISGRRLTAPATRDVWILDESNNQVVRWQDGATTPLGYATNVTMNDIWGASSTDVFVVGQDEGASVGVILRRSGTQWVAMDSGAHLPLSVVWGRSANDVYAAGNGVLLHYDGTSWTPMTPPTSSVFDLWGPSHDDMFLVGYEGAYHFDGVQWSPVDAGAPFSVNAITGVGKSVFWVDYKGGVHQLVRTIPW